MSNKFEQADEQYLANTREACYGLWNALLTTNTIIGSSISAIAVLDGTLTTRIIASSVVAICILSSYLLVSNYTEVREHYRYLGTLTAEEFEKMSPEQVAKDRQRGNSAFVRIARREKFVKLLLLVEVAVVIVLIVSAKTSRMSAF